MWDDSTDVDRHVLAESGQSLHTWVEAWLTKQHGNATDSTQADASRQARVAAWDLAMGIAVTLTHLYGQPDLGQCQCV